jgi:GT2 family glycosyltransferase
LNIYNNKAYIVIVHYNDANILLDCVSSLRNLKCAPYSIIIVNYNRCSDIALSLQRVIDSRTVQVISHQINMGYAWGNNVGLTKALSQGANYILLLNDDTVVSPDFVDILVEEGERSRDVGILGPKIYYSTEPEKIWFAGAKFDSQNCTVSTYGFDLIGQRDESLPMESDYISGCALLIKRETIERIGLLDERFFLYWEDVDWCLRAQNAGFKNLVVPSARIWHKISVSTGGMDSPLRAYHKTRSHLFFAKLHAPWALRRLHNMFLRDIAWLLIKSNELDRIKKSRAYISAIRDYHLGRTNKGPKWLWEEL